MHRKIVFYELNGVINHEELLNDKSVRQTNGMMVKCHIKNGTEETGFVDIYHIQDRNFDNSICDYINLWIWNNLDEEKHELIGNEDSKYNKTFRKVKINDIIYIEAILHSSPKWGGKLTNSFDYFVSHFTSNK